MQCNKCLAIIAFIDCGFKHTFVNKKYFFISFSTTLSSKHIHCCTVKHTRVSYLCLRCLSKCNDCTNILERDRRFLERTRYPVLGTDQISGSRNRPDIRFLERAIYPWKRLDFYFLNRTRYPVLGTDQISVQKLPWSDIRRSQSTDIR